MKWQVRFVRNAVVGVLPSSSREALRRLKRNVLPHEIEIDPVTLRQGLQQVDMLLAAGCSLKGADYLELGTGWAPVIPLIFSLAGCRTATLVDSQHLMDAHTFAQTCRKLRAHKDVLSQSLGVPASEIDRRLAEPTEASLEAGLAAFGARYLSPYDFLSAELPAGSFDVITSRAVLEHVPPDVIRRMFQESRRLLRPGGHMCHIIDNSDHWEHNDKSISRLNFLRYSEKTFGLFSSMNPLDYQNRLRHSQYRAMMEAAGFTVVHDASHTDAKALASVGSLTLHPSFAGFAKEDLAVLTSNLVARNGDGR